MARTSRHRASDTSRQTSQVCSSSAAAVSSVAFWQVRMSIRRYMVTRQSTRSVSASKRSSTVLALEPLDSRARIASISSRKGAASRCSQVMSAQFTSAWGWSVKKSVSRASAARPTGHMASSRDRTSSRVSSFFRIAVLSILS